VNDPNCPTCKCAMEVGYLPDCTDFKSNYQTPMWHAGEPRATKFFGLPLHAKVRRAQMSPVLTYRCPECCLLQSYASNDPRPSREAR
jgi:hypothetical protein